MYQLNSIIKSREIPYDLKFGSKDSSKFYKDLDKITNRVILKGILDLKDIIHEYKKFSDSRHSDSEILLNILISGIMWQEYAGIKVPRLVLKRRILSALYSLRKHSFLKKQVDHFRGKLVSAWLTGSRKKNLTINFQNLDKLITFLMATCEFKEETKRMSGLRNFLECADKYNSERKMERIVSFAEWFKNTAAFYLGNYTAGVGHFLSDHGAKYKGREDFFFCGRKEVEYHLNIVGACIMNRTLQYEFSQTRDKILLLPTCMALKGSDCRTRPVNGDLSCMHCTPSCNISKAAKEMEEKGIRTVLIKHSSSFSKWLEPWSNQEETGLIGVACVLNLLTGGFEMKRLGIPSQCVFLDHAGCKKHWQGSKASEINTNQVCRATCSFN